VTGLVLSGGFRPSDSLLAELREAGLFTFVVETDTYRTAQDVHDILVKTHPTDTEKIATIIDLVGRSLDPEALLARL
jgi:BioD-like phosphotransacetylase family protein